MATETPKFVPKSFISCFDNLRNDKEADYCSFGLLSTIEDKPKLLLGPCILDHNHVPSSFKPYILTRGNEKLPIQHSSIKDIWLFASSRFRSFPLFDKRFYSWYLRLKDDLETQLSWKNADIETALEVSILSHDLDRGLLGFAVCFRSASTNCFFFPWGPMSVTLLDVFTISRFISHGNPVEKVEASGNHYISDSIIAYGKFFDIFLKTTGPVNLTEHVTFFYWLSKYVFFSSTLKVSKDYVNFAVNLARRRQFSLGPLVLVLYKSITDAALSMMSKEKWVLSGPF